MFGPSHRSIWPLSAVPRARVSVLFAAIATMSLITIGCVPSTDTNASADGTTGEEGDSAAGSANGGDDVEVIQGVEARLLRVIDGDSLELDIEGREVEVRLKGVNAPELYGPSGRQAGDDKTCNGEAAKQALTLLLEDEELTVIGDETDRFGRRLVDLRAGSRSTVLDMVELGWGLATGADNDELRDSMKEAAEGRAGLWGDICGSPQNLGLAIGETQVNPPGSDRENPNDEWVTVVNGGSEAVDLAGWEIRDDTTGHRYRLQTVLEAGATLTVRSGSGTTTAADMYLDETFPVWSNSGETVLLSDPRGVVTAWAFIDQDGTRS